MRSEASAVRRVASVVLACAALAGCADMARNLNPVNWFSSAPTGPKPAALPVLAGAQAEARTLWQASFGAAGPFVFRPVVEGDSVYAASRDGTVVRLAAANGAPRWRVSAGGMLSGGVGSDGKFVVVGSDKGEVIALDAGTGTVRWRARVSSEVLAAPEVAEGLALVRSADSRIFAFGLEDGKRRWVYQRAAAALVVRSPAGMIVRQGNVYAGFAGGKLVAISLANGAARWEATVALPKGATELERVTDIAGDPAAIGREICAAAYQGRVACYDMANGNQLWARDMSTFTGVSADARQAYVSDDRGTLHAFDRSNGRTLWKQERLSHRRLSLPLAVGNEVAVGDFQGYVHFLARASGEFVSRAATDGSAILAAPQRIPGGLLVQTQNGGLYAIAAAP